MILNRVLDILEYRGKLGFSLVHESWFKSGSLPPWTCIIDGL